MTTVESRVGNKVKWRYYVEELKPRDYGMIQGARCWGFTVRVGFHNGIGDLFKCRNLLEALRLALEDVDYDPEDGSREASTINHYGRRITLYQCVDGTEAFGCD